MNRDLPTPFYDPRFGVSSAEILLAAADFSRRGGLAFATIVARDGVSARPVGAQIVAAEDGAYAGSLSSGCVDAAIVALALSAIAQGAGRRLRIGAGSPIVDLRLPCGGGMEILITSPRDVSALDKAAAALAARRDATLIFTEDALFGEDAAGTPEAFVLQILPPLKLLIAGRGANLAAMARAALAAHLNVAGWSPDPDDARLLAACGVLIERRWQALVDQLDERSALVLLFHEHEREIEILAQALDRPCFYIGAMGARTTHARRLDALEAAGVRQEVVMRLRGPIGLVPSVRDPNALAISVLAEVLSVAKERSLL